MIQVESKPPGQPDLKRTKSDAKNKRSAVHCAYLSQPAVWFPFTVFFSLDWWTEVHPSFECLLQSHTVVKLDVPTLYSFLLCVACIITTKFYQSCLCQIQAWLSQMITAFPDNSTRCLRAMQNRYWCYSPHSSVDNMCLFYLWQSPSQANQVRQEIRHRQGKIISLTKKTQNIM